MENFNNQNYFFPLFILGHHLGNSSWELFKLQRHSLNLNNKRAGH